MSRNTSFRTLVKHPSVLKSHGLPHHSLLSSSQRRLYEMRTYPDFILPDATLKLKQQSRRAAKIVTTPTLLLNIQTDTLWPSL